MISHLVTTKRVQNIQQLLHASKPCLFESHTIFEWMVGHEGYRKVYPLFAGTISGRIVL